MERKNVAVLFGGKSVEHEVSISSAENVCRAIDQCAYLPYGIGIDRNGRWWSIASPFERVERRMFEELARGRRGKEVSLRRSNTEGKVWVVNAETGERLYLVDVVFPVLHGTFGEDGTVQGMLEMLGVPFVGSGVLGSAVGIEKDVSKRLLRDAGVPTAKFISLRDFQKDEIREENITRILGFPVFVKPANLGSSVGVTKAKDFPSLLCAVEEAFQYSSKVLIEEYIHGREIECSVLGNEHPIASLPGEVIPRHEFYSYEAKYLEKDGAVLRIPAPLHEDVVREVRKLSVKAFQVLGCEGMARVDFFVRNEREVFVNEVNTIPGFTEISMYPKLWEVSGISYQKLVSRLLELAFLRYTREQKLKRTR